MKIGIKKLYSSSVLPTKGSIGAACYDLVINNIKQEDNVVKVGYGIALDIPEGYKAVIVPRSSFTGKGWTLANSPCQIDPDYKGELMSKFEAIPNGTFSLDGGRHLSPNLKLLYPSYPYHVGDRVTQLYIEKIIETEFYEVEELTQSVRGNQGFGSTGKTKIVNHAK